MASVRAAAALSGAIVLRLLREGLVVRALAWPGIVCALAMVGTAGGYAMWGTSPSVVVADPALAKQMTEHGFTAELSEDPQKEIRNHRAIRAVWRENDRWVLGRVWPGRATLRLESLLREIAGARWRIDIPPLEARPTDVDYQAHLIAGVIGLFFTLYGVVMGAGTVFRDRGNGCLESELSLPLPFWMHGAARIAALSVVLVPALCTTLLVLHGLLGIDSLSTWMLHDCLAALTGGVLGLAATSGPKSDKGFSAPLSRALATTIALIGAGWALPQLGRWLPLSSIGAFLAGLDPAATAAPLALAAAGAAALRFGRSECI